MYNYKQVAPTELKPLLEINYCYKQVASKRLNAKGIKKRAPWARSVCRKINNKEEKTL